ncbi:SMODS domain-containing nucleotidyltransferase [Methylobacter sp.]|uniref:SMODS domain-containing nucleotidyltransferase n=1 Tax=Methylobacter sp. TaxID=2051955 RepID=UPI003DA625D8
MTVLSYLQKRASNAVLSGNENESINRSIYTLQARLNSYFGNRIKNHFQFGSSTRGTILPRSMDEKSDIDYMIVFSQEGFVPQTYLNWLKSFVEYYYSRSEIYQSSPTVVLELNHIKFDLVPALQNYIGNIRIPNGSNQWQYTNPNDFNQSLVNANNQNNSLIKPTIRLVKYWNAQNNYLYSSFEFEKWIIDLNFWGCTNQKDYLYKVFDNLSEHREQVQWKKDKIIRAKSFIQRARAYEAIGSLAALAETEILKLIP